jgi:hypothetical protein
MLARDERSRVSDEARRFNATDTRLKFGIGIGRREMTSWGPCPSGSQRSSKLHRYGQGVKYQKGVNL